MVVELIISILICIGSLYATRRLRKRFNKTQFNELLKDFMIALMGGTVAAVVVEFGNKLALPSAIGYIYLFAIIATATTFSFALIMYVLAPSKRKSRRVLK